MCRKFQRLIPMKVKRPRMTARWGDRMKRMRREEAKAMVAVRRRRQRKSSFTLPNQSTLVFPTSSASGSLCRCCPSRFILFQ